MKRFRNHIKARLRNPIALTALSRKSAGPMNLSKKLSHKRDRQNWKKELKNKHVTVL